MLVQVVFPFTILKDLRVLVKFNGLGFVFVWYCVLFIVFKGSQALWHGLVNTSEHAGPVPVADVHPSTTVDMVASVSFGAMTGMATLAFFIHNIIHTITKNSDPKVVKRDVVLGYLMAGGVYVLVAVMGAFGLSESVPTAVHLDNILVVYSDSYVLPVMCDDGTVDVSSDGSLMLLAGWFVVGRLLFFYLCADFMYHGFGVYHVWFVCCAPTETGTQSQRKWRKCCN